METTQSPVDLTKMTRDEKLKLFDEIEKSVYGEKVMTLRGKYHFVVFPFCSNQESATAIMTRFYKNLEGTSSYAYEKESAQILYMAYLDEDEKPALKFDCAMERVPTVAHSYRDSTYYDSKFTENFVEHPEARAVYEALKERYANHYAYLVLRVCAADNTLYDVSPTSTFLLLDPEENNPYAKYKDIDRIYTAFLKTRYCDFTDRDPDYRTKRFDITVKGAKCTVLERQTFCESGG